MVRAVSRLEALPFLRKRSTVSPPLVLFQRIMKVSPAVRVSLPMGVVKELTAKAPMAEERAKRAVENFIIIDISERL